MKWMQILALTVLFLTSAAVAQDTLAPTTPDPATKPSATEAATPPETTSKPAATEYTLPQEYDIPFRLYPTDDAIYFCCADADQPQAVPGGPPVRKSYGTYMRYDLKTGAITNVLATIPGRFNPAKLKVCPFQISPDGKYAFMQVHSAAGTSLGGCYMVDLQKQTAKKFLPAAEQQFVTWCGNEIAMSVKVLAQKGGMKGNVITVDSYNLLQPVRYSVTGARLGNLPACGNVWGSNRAGDIIIMRCDPQAMKQPVVDNAKAQIVMMTKEGKVLRPIPVSANAGYGVVYSADLKYASAQGCNIIGAKQIPGRNAMPVNAVAFTLDGNVTTIELPEPEKASAAVWVGDDGTLLTKRPVSEEYSCYSPKGQKLWTVEKVQAMGVWNGHAYFIQKDNLKLIKVKPLTAEKAQ